MANPLSRYGVSDRDYAATVGTAMGEAMREGVQGMAAVMDVMANRLQSDDTYGDPNEPGLAGVAYAARPSGTGKEFDTWNASVAPNAYKTAVAAARAVSDPKFRATLSKDFQSKLEQAEKAAFGVLGTGDLRGVARGATFYGNRSLMSASRNKEHDALAGGRGMMKIGNHTFYGPDFSWDNKYDPQGAYGRLEKNWNYFQGGDTPGEELAAERQQKAFRDTFTGGADFGPPVWDGTSVGNTQVESAPLGPPTRYDPLSSIQAPMGTVAPPKSYDPLSSISAPAQAPAPAPPGTGASLAGEAIGAARQVNEDRSSREPSAPAPTPQDAGLNSALFSGAPMGAPQTFGGFSPSFTDKSTFTGGDPAPAPAPAPPTVTRPPQPQTTLGVQPGFQPTGYDISVYQGVPLSDITPKAAPKPVAAPPAPVAPPPAPQVAYDPLSSIQAPKPAVGFPAPPEPATASLEDVAPAPAYAPATPPLAVPAPKVSAVSAPQRAPRVAPSRPQPSVGPQTQAMDQPQDPVQSFSQQVGTPQNFMSMSPKDFGMAVGAMAALSPNAQKINALASQVSDPKVGIVAQNALQNEYAGLTGQPQTKSLWGGLWGDLSKAFGSSPEIGFNNSPDSKQGMYVQGLDGSPVWGAFSDLQKQINAGTAGGWGSGGFGPGTSGLW